MKVVGVDAHRFKSEQSHGPLNTIQVMRGCPRAVNWILQPEEEDSAD